MNLKKIAITGLALACLSVGSVAHAAKHVIDPAHTFVLFKVGHLGVGTAYGMFRKVSGSFDAEKGSVKVEIDVASLYTNNQKRDEHLRGPDFFNAKEFPKITFESTRMKKKSGNMYEVTGNLTIKGKTKKVSFMAEMTGTGVHPVSKKEIMGFAAELTVNRMDFGVDYMPGGLSDEVVIMLATEGAKAE